MSDLSRTIPMLVRAAPGVALRLINPVGDNSFLLTLVFWIFHMGFRLTPLGQPQGMP